MRGAQAQAQPQTQPTKHEKSNTWSLRKAYENMGLETEYEAEQEQRGGQPRIVWILGTIVERIIKKDEKMSKKKDLVTVFHGTRAPSLSVHQYLDRIFRYSSCSPACFVVAYVYLDRFLNRTNGLITSLNVHRLLITAVMLAAKFLDDDCYNNAYYAKVGGITNAELNKLEMKFLITVDFSLHVTVDTFNTYCLHMETQVNGQCHVDMPARILGFTKNICTRAAAGHSCKPL